MSDASELGTVRAERDALRATLKRVEAAVMNQSSIVSPTQAILDAPSPPEAHGETTEAQEARGEANHHA